MSDPTTDLCSIPDCTNQRTCRGWCVKHYRRWQRNGDPLRVKQAQAMNGATTEFFLANYLSDGGECVLWPYGCSTASNGSLYGMVTWDGKQWRTNVLSCTLAHGPRPFPGAEARHAVCGNSLCISAAHLKWGTHKENMEDAVRHGTTARGNPAISKLTENDVREIRQHPTTHPSILAEQYGVSSRAICDIRTGRTWSWVT